MKIAFYAPLKPPDHPNPSGDRLLARLFIQALEAAGHEVILASSFRSFERAGSTQAQLAIQAAGVTEREALIQRFQQESPPDLWFSYHIYHRAPDWIGPEVAAYFKIPYVVAEASVSPKHANGPWQQGYLRGRQCIRYADAMVSINPRDLECAAPLLRRETPLLRLKPFIDTSGFPRARTHEATTPLRLVSVAMMRPGDNALWLTVDEVIDDSNPTGREGGESYDQRPGTAGIGTDNCPGSVDGVCQMGWIAADIRAAANNDFLAANPAVEKMLELFQMDVVEVSLMNVEMADGADVLDLAAQWIEDNRDLVDSWIAEAMAAA